MSRKIPQRFWLLGSLAGVALLASIMVPLALAQGRPASLAGRILGQNGECVERRLPHPLELNMEDAGSRFKAIAMEKEVFECGGDEINGPNEVRDVQTFIEIVEQVVDDDHNGSGDKVRTVEVRAEVATCVKNFGPAPAGGAGPAFVTCSAENRPVTRIGPDEVTGCRASFKQPDDPVEMQTAETEGIVKTVAVEKELLDCTAPNGDATVFGSPGEFRGELFLFTEIIERTKGVTIGGKPTTSIRPIKGGKRFLAVICGKSSLSGEPFGCAQFTPPGPPSPD